MFTRVKVLREGDADVDDNDAGLPNLFWWCDRENGVAGIIATQILPFCGKVFDFNVWCFVVWEGGWRLRIGIEDDMLILFGIDADVLGLWANIESAVYEDLKSEKAGGHGDWDGHHQEFVAKSES